MFNMKTYLFAIFLKSTKLYFCVFPLKLSDGNFIAMLSKYKSFYVNINWYRFTIVNLPSFPLPTSYHPTPLPTEAKLQERLN